MFIGDTLELSEEGKKEFLELDKELQAVWEANRKFLQEGINRRYVGIRSSQIGALIILMVKAESEA